MGARGLRWAPWALVLACGGPLDRQDGALALELRDLPPGTEQLRVTLQSGGRSFQKSLPWPQATPLSVFSAVPIGPALVDVEAGAGAAVLGAVRGLPVEIVLDQVAALQVQFRSVPGPLLVLEGGTTRRSHPIWAGPIFVTVRDQLLDARVVTLVVSVNGEPLASPSLDGGQATLSIDPRLAGPVLPEILNVELKGCFANGECAAQTLEIEVHRRVWSRDLGRLPNVRPVFDPETGRVVLGGEDGRLHLIDTATGSDTIVTLSGRLARPSAISERTLGVVDGGGVLHGIDLDTLQIRWSLPLEPDATGVTAAGGRFYVGSGRSLLEVDAPTGRSVTRYLMPGPIGAPPSADPEGVLLADLLGNVVALDPNGDLQFSATVGHPVVIPPIRFRGEVVAIDQDGGVSRWRLDGSPAAPPFALGGTVVLPALVQADRLVVAAQRTLWWLGGPEPLSQGLGVPILGAPTPFGPTGVVVGLRDGQLLVAEPGSPARVLSKLPSASLSPLSLPGVEREILGVGVGGRVERLRAEEEF